MNNMCKKYGSVFTSGIFIVILLVVIVLLNSFVRGTELPLSEELTLFKSTINGIFNVLSIFMEWCLYV